MKIETPPGCCIACGARLPKDKRPGRPRSLCRDEACVELYNRVYSLDRWAAHRQAVSPAGVDFLLAQARMLRSIGDSLVRYANQL